MYRILRDNKERGPLNLEQLLELRLQPFDLVWVEGKSAGWRYPSEIDALKVHVEPSIQPVRDNDTTVISAASQHPASQNTRSISPVSPLASAPASFSTESENEEELTADKLEKRATEIYQRVQAYAEQQEKSQKDTQIKYARSLEDLKQEYADWLHKKNEKKHFRLVSIRKPGLIAATIACMMVVAASLFFIHHDQQQQQAGLKPGQHYISDAVSGPAVHPPSQEIIVVPPKTSISEVTKSTLKKELSVDDFIDSVRRVLAKENRSERKKLVKPDHSDLESGEVITKVPNATEPVVPTDKKETPPLQKVNMNAKYQQDANRKSISSLEVTIQNNSVELLKTVTVDIFYYKKGERLFDKETLYFNNIQPGNSLTLSRPGNRKAVTARFQLGQINSAEN